MKITFDVDGVQVGQSLASILNSLPEQRKVDLAREVMQGWLNEPHGYERAAYERQVIEQLRTLNQEFSRYSDEQLRERYEFKDRIKTTSRLAMS